MNCSILSSDTIFIHQENIYEICKFSQINICHFIDDNTISVLNSNFSRNQKRQKSERCISDCYSLNTSSLPQFMRLLDHILKLLIYSTQSNLSPNISPQIQYLNIFPNKGVNIDKAWEPFLG